jgi:hypothetical protein
MNKAIIEITPNDPDKYFDIQTNGLNKVHIELGLRACLKALQEDLKEEAIKEVGYSISAQQKWYDNQIPKHLKKW